MKPVPHPHTSLLLSLVVSSLLLFVVSTFFFIFGFTEIALIAGIFQSGIFFIVVLLYFFGLRDKKQIERLLSGEDLLAQWNFNADSWNRFVQSEYKRQKENAITTAIAFFIAGPIAGLLKDPDNWYISGPIMGAALGGFGYFIAVTSAKAFRKTAAVEKPEIYIGRRAIYIHGLFISFTGIGRRLQRIEITADPDSQQQSLKISYFVRGRYNEQEREFFVPIPIGKEGEAKHIVNVISETSY